MIMQKKSCWTNPAKGRFNVAWLFCLNTKKTRERPGVAAFLIGGGKGSTFKLEDNAGTRTNGERMTVQILGLKLERGLNCQRSKILPNPGEERKISSLKSYFRGSEKHCRIQPCELDSQVRPIEQHGAFDKVCHSSPGGMSAPAI